ncbi:MAG: glycosyltransferase family 4 protein [Planctomycetes bacterium]|nr:glycosyltransferase family 4 protein [Planctomycetota bacterium]
MFNPDVRATFGGAEVDLYLLASELAKDKRFAVSFVVGDYGQPDTEIIEGVTLHKSLNVNKNLFLHAPKIWKALKKANADIYMSEACSLGTFLYAFFCKINKKVFIYRTAHTRETDGSYFQQNKFRSIFVKWAFRQARPLITQNNTDAQKISATLGLPSVVIRNACRIPQTQSTKDGFILWVGRSLPIKRPDLFFKLARQFPDKSFVMICPQGSGDTNYESLRKEAEKIGNLQFLSYVPFNEIDSWFERASVFVSTSDSEGFPNTFVQACKAATAILSLNVNPDGFLDKYHCGFSTEGNWDILSDTLNKWIATDQARELGLHGKEYIQSHHNINHIIEQYKKMFHEIDL